VVQASFGGAVSSLFGRQLPLSEASPAGACAPLSNGVAVAGTVALVQRGGCLIAEKARVRAITLSEPEPEPEVKSDAKPVRESVEERSCRQAGRGCQGVSAAPRLQSACRSAPDGRQPPPAHARGRAGAQAPHPTLC